MSPSEAFLEFFFFLSIMRKFISLHCGHAFSVFDHNSLFAISPDPFLFFFFPRPRLPPSSPASTPPPATETPPFPDPFLKELCYFSIKLTSPKRKIFPLLKTSLWWLILCVNLTNIITNNNKKCNSIQRKFWKTCSINNVRITSLEKVSAFPRWPFWRDSYAVKVSNWVFKVFIFFFTKAYIN